MYEHDDFDINITQSEDSELTEKEYSDILGLEGMAGGGEAALEENEEEKEEDTLVYILEEQHDKKQKPAYVKPFDTSINEHEQIVHIEIKSTEVSIQESMQIPIPEQYTSPNKTFRQEEMVEVFLYAKKQEDNKMVIQPFNPIKTDSKQEIAQGQSEKTTKDVNVVGISNAEGQKDTAAEQGKTDIEASVHAHESKEETAREFRTSVDIDNKISNVYEQGKTAVRSMTEDELVSEGHRETEKYVKPVTRAVVMFASSSVIGNIKSELEKSTKAVEETVSLIEQGKLSLSDLNGKKKELTEKLKKLELPKGSIHHIVCARYHFSTLPHSVETESHRFINYLF